MHDLRLVAFQVLSLRTVKISHSIVSLKEQGHYYEEGVFLAATNVYSTTSHPKPVTTAFSNWKMRRLEAIIKHDRLSRHDHATFNIKQKSAVASAGEWIFVFEGSRHAAAAKAADGVIYMKSRCGMSKV